MEEFRADILLLSQIIGTDLSHWPRAADDSAYTERNASGSSPPNGVRTPGPPWSATTGRARQTRESGGPKL